VRYARNVKKQIKENTYSGFSGMVGMYLPVSI